MDTAARLLIDCFMDHGINSSHGWCLCARPLHAESLKMLILLHRRNVFYVIESTTRIFLNLEIPVSLIELLISQPLSILTDSIEQ